MKKILKDWYISGGGGPSYSAGYQAILDRATALGYTHPSDACKTLQNQLYVDLEAINFFSTYQDIFRCYAHDGNLNFGLINWVNPNSFLGTMPAGDLTFTSKSGFVSGNGSKYVSDNYTPSTDSINYDLNDCSIFLYKKTANTINTANGTIQTASGTTVRLQFQRSSNLMYLDMNGVTVFSGASQTTTTGLFSLQNTAGNDFRFYRGATFVNNNVLAGSSLPAQVLRNCWYGDDTISFIGYGKYFVSELSTVNTLISNYVTDVALI